MVIPCAGTGPIMDDEKTCIRLNPIAARRRILTELGFGGMAQVYLAVAQGFAGFNKLVVLKILKRDLASQAEIRNGFLREARLLARMNHPNVVAVNEVEEWDGIPVIVMEHLQGHTLADILRRRDIHAPLSVKLRILSDSLSGLHYAHELNDFDGTSLHIVHRDFTPQNIFITYDGCVKVLDFGIAQVTGSKAHLAAGNVMGKLRYMAPEQIIGASLDRRTDVFAVGILLCELATGQRFWGAATDSVVIKRIRSGDIPAPQNFARGCPEALARICAKALSFSKESRYGTIAEMQADIEAFIADNALQVSNLELGKRLVDWFRKDRDEAQQLIERSLSNNTYESWSNIALETAVSSTATSPSIAATEMVVDVPVRASHSSIVAIRGRRLGKWVGSAAAGLLLLFFATTIHFRGQALPAVAKVNSGQVQSSASKSVKVKITAYPAVAALFIDNVAVAGNPHIQQYPRDGGSHSLRVEAPGYSPVERTLQFHRDSELAISLSAKAIEPILSAPPTSVEPLGRPPSKDASRAKLVPPSKKPISRARVSCSPPFTYDERGVKHFKLECL